MIVQDIDSGIYTVDMRSAYAVYDLREVESKWQKLS